MRDKSVEISDDRLLSGASKHIAFEFDPMVASDWVMEHIVGSGWDIYTHREVNLGDVLSNDLEICHYNPDGTPKEMVVYHCHALVIFNEEVSKIEDYGEFIKETINKIDTDGEPLHVPLLAAHITARNYGIDFDDVIYGLMASDHDLVLHFPYSIDLLENIYRDGLEKRGISQKQLK